MGLIADIRNAIADNLRTIQDIQISPYIKNNATPPVLMVLPGPPGGGDFTSYHQAMGNGMDEMSWTVRCEVAIGLEDAAQMKLDDMLEPTGTGSVKAALEANKTLGGLVDDLVVRRSVAGLVVSRDGMAEKLAAEWEVTVLT